uniref:Ladinin n=1 Tax=Amphilophus citrinellus TaxID=61819 RepID=A0A3Q0SC15_AMPCI
MSLSRRNWSALSSMEQVQLDFVEMLRVRDERRRMRHVETLRRQKEEGEDEAEVSGGGGGGARVELLGDMGEEEGSVVKPQPSVKTASHSTSTSTGTSTSNNARSRKSEKSIFLSVSISLDKSPSVSGRTTPMSPGSNFEQAPKPAFIRQSSRTVSFRMMKKKEEEASPLQRQNEEENKTPSFQRSRQRISSRSIQEKMERLAQAAQKSELTRFPDVTQRTLVLLEEVSRKRGIFEKEQQQQQAQSPTSPGVSRQEFRGFTSGMSDRINRWLNKDLRHVDITSKRSLFENRG